MKICENNTIAENSPSSFKMKKFSESQIRATTHKLHSIFKNQRDFHPPNQIIQEDEYKTKDFQWVVEHMLRKFSTLILATHSHIHGCEVLIPKTYFFNNGKAKFMVKSEFDVRKHNLIKNSLGSKKHFLTAVTHPKKLTLVAIRKDIQMVPRVVKTRIRSNKMSQMSAKTKISSSMSKKSEVSSNIQNSHEVSSNTNPQNPKNQVSSPTLGKHFQTAKIIKISFLFRPAV